MQNALTQPTTASAPASALTSTPISPAGMAASQPLSLPAQLLGLGIPLPSRRMLDQQADFNAKRIAHLTACLEASKKELARMQAVYASNRANAAAAVVAATASGTQSSGAAANPTPTRAPSATRPSSVQEKSPASSAASPKAKPSIAKTDGRRPRRAVGTAASDTATSSSSQRGPLRKPKRSRPETSTPAQPRTPAGSVAGQLDSTPTGASPQADQTTATSTPVRPRLWTTEEIDRFRAGAKEHGPRSWRLIAASVGTRTEKQVRAFAQRLAKREASKSAKPVQKTPQAATASAAKAEAQTGSAKNESAQNTTPTRTDVPPSPEAPTTPAVVDSSEEVPAGQGKLPKDGLASLSLPDTIRVCSSVSMSPVTPNLVTSDPLAVGKGIMADMPVFADSLPAPADALGMFGVGAVEQSSVSMSSVGVGTSMSCSSLSSCGAGDCCSAEPVRSELSSLGAGLSTDHLEVVGDVEMADRGHASEMPVDGADAWAPFESFDADNMEWPASDVVTPLELTRNLCPLDDSFEAADHLLEVI